MLNPAKLNKIELMQKRFLLFLLIFTLSVPVQGKGLVDTPRWEAALIRESSETFYQAIFYELQASPVGVQLTKKLEGHLSWEEFQKEDPTAKIDFFEKIKNLILKTQSLSLEEQKTLDQAIQAARKYLALPTDVLIQNAAPPEKPKPENPITDAVLKNDWSDKVAKTQVSKVVWNGIDSYVKTRLGPVRAALDSLSEKDTVFFTNLSIARVAAQFSDITQMSLLTLPISSYQKKIWLLTRSNQSKILVLSEIHGEALILHFQMLTKWYLEHQGLHPKITVLESKKANLPYYDSLSRFYSAHSKEIGQPNAVIFGYASTFHSLWERFFVKKIDDPKLHWSVEIFALPSGKKAMTISTHLPVHGEILSKNIARMIKKSPKTHFVFTTGSAGAIGIRKPYEVYFPKTLQGSRGQELSNVLSTGDQESIHRSVDSPLEETPDFLEKWTRSGISSVDMEFGHFPEVIAHDSSVEVGVGVMITDFPKYPNIFPEVKISTKNTALIKKSIHRFVQAVFDRIELGKKPKGQIAETVLDSELRQLSEENIARYQKQLKPLSSDEKKLFTKMNRELSPQLFIRVTENRLKKILDDHVFLSSGMVNEIKGEKTFPTTPSAEHQIFGAYDYVFGSFGFITGQDRYGKVAIKVRPDVWKRRSWGSESSAFHVYSRVFKKLGRVPESQEFIKNEEELKLVQSEFKKTVFIPKDYLEALYFRVLSQLRERDPAQRKTLLESTPEDLPQRMRGFDLGYLEAKIEYSLNLEDIEEILMPDDAPADLLQRAKSALIQTSAQ